MGARRAVASRVGATVVDGARCEQRPTTAGNRKARENCKKKKKILKAVFSRTITNVHLV